MANGITFNGLSSGLDTKSIIDKLVSVKTQQSIDPVKNEISLIKTKSNAINSLVDLFKNLKAVSKVLNDPSNEAYTAKTGVSSNTDDVLVTSVNSLRAINGTYNISDVSQLAQADRVIFDGEADKDTTTFGTGTFSITYKGATTNVTITSSNNTLEGIAGAINSADAGVRAAIINDGSATPYRLVLTAEDTGADTGITHTIDSTLTGLAVDTIRSGLDVNQPQSAIFKVNGVTMTSTTNEVSEAIPGVTFSLLNENETSVNVITVKQNTASIVASVSSFVTAFKNLRKSLQSAISPDKTTGEFGPLGHDLDLSSANININRVFTRSFIGLSGYEYQSLSQIGITFDASGEIQLDSTKLTAAIESHPTDVRKLFQGSDSEDGIAESLYNYLDIFTRPAGTFDQRTQASTSKLADLTLKLTENQKSVQNYTDFLTRRFTAMETAISLLKNQQAALDSYNGTYSNSSNRLL